MIGTLIILGLLLACLILRQPVMIILLAVAATVHLVWGQGQLDYIIEDMWVSLDKKLILAIPMFVLCGGVMTKGSTAKRLIDIASALTGHLPGGLAVASVLSCGVFAAISGSSIVTMLAIGSVMYPALREANYSNRFSLGILMAGGTMGIIIPPSIPLILYGLVIDTSIGDLFLAGIGPGLLILFLFSGYAIWMNRHLPRDSFNWGRLLTACKKGIWAVLMPVILLGGIYSGYFSATEAAAVALIYALIVEFFIHRDLTLRELYDVVLETSKLGGTVFPLLAIALSLNLVLTEQRVPLMMVEYVQTYITSPLAFILLVNILLIIAGCLLPIVEAILILAPLLVPMAEAYGYDKVLFGVIMIINLEIGFLTPPMGLNLLVAMSAFKQKFFELVASAIPFILLLTVSLAIIIWQPWIATGLIDS